MAVEAFARAKINLALHVTGRRGDGYHLIDSMVAFADLGDRVTVEPAKTLTLHLTGPYAADLSAADNLCLKAARALHPTRSARITLEKHLPVASGIGGGSADAAAVLKALAQLWDLPLPPSATILALGADVPVCLAGHAARMQGVGDQITPIPLPEAWLVLANPGIAVATADVFRTLQHRANPPLQPLPALPDVAILAIYLQAQRNDLEPPARHLAPILTEVIASLRTQPGCLFARMSGSGATCFGLFADEDSAFRAASMLGHGHKHWWIKAARLSP